MKTNDELNAMKQEQKMMQPKQSELNEEQLNLVTGGINPEDYIANCQNRLDTEATKAANQIKNGGATIEKYEMARDEAEKAIEAERTEAIGQIASESAGAASGMSMLADIIFHKKELK